MDSFGVIAFAMATSALSLAIVGFVLFHIRLNNLEKKLKDFDVIPKEFNSLAEPEKELLSQD